MHQDSVKNYLKMLVFFNSYFLENSNEMLEILMTIHFQGCDNEAVLYDVIETIENTLDKKGSMT